MKVGVMQPYFVPYIGYWQLINVVDKYVIYDDVNFIKRGWINRNQILINGTPCFFNIPMLGMSQNKLINQIEVNHDKNMLDKNIRTIQENYRRAPFYNEVYPMIEKILNCKEKNIAGYIINSLYLICDYLDIKTELIVSSTMKKDNTLKGQSKILDICQRLGATEYYNAIGGKELYSREEFTNKGIQLYFLKSKELTYEQFGADFVRNLSIIDVLMFNSCDKVKQYLNDFDLE